jgi:hypothetical protein
MKNKNSSSLVKITKMKKITIMKKKIEKKKLIRKDKTHPLWKKLKIKIF